MTPDVESWAATVRRLIRYDEFVQRVRRHRTTDVLEAVAAASVVLTERDYGDRRDAPFTDNVQQWSLSAVAKAAIVAGNDHRSHAVTEDDLERMCETFINVEEPFTHEPNAPGSLAAFLIRTAYEQFPSQLSVFEELARTQALLADAVSKTAQNVITPAFWDDALGCSLTDFVGVGLLLNIGALKNGGYYDPGWLSQPNFGPVLDHLPKDVIEPVAARHFLASREMFRRTAHLHSIEDRYLRRFEFNPLAVHPFVQQPDGRYIGPSPRYALTRTSPTGLYYIGLEHGGTTFSQALGAVFEQYIGAQLGLLHPEITLHDVEYERGKKAADWIVVLPKAVLIVEVKATPLTAAARVGTERLAEDLDRAPGRAIEQIDQTSALIKQRHRALSNVPADRPIVGLVVTLEPYFQCNSDLVWARPESETPIVLAASRELEALVTIADAGVDEFLVDLVRDEELSRWSLGRAVAKHQCRRNPILDQAWSRYPFRSVDQNTAA